MQTQPVFGFPEFLVHAVGEMARAISERPGETGQRQFERCQAATHMILGFAPRDVTEVSLAGHCVMFHAMMVRSAREILRGEGDRGARGNLIALNRAFTGNLDRLERYRARPSTGCRDAAEARVKRPAAEHVKRPAAAGPETVARTAEPPEETTMQTAAMPMETHDSDRTPAAPPMNRKARRLAEQAGRRALRGRAKTPAPGVAPVMMPPVVETFPEATIAMHPTSADMARLEYINPAAAAAVIAADAMDFARAWGVAQPSAAFLAAAALPGSPFDRSVTWPWRKVEAVGPDVGLDTAGLETDGPDVVEPGMATAGT
jgi:hypothetical protein